MRSKTSKKNNSKKSDDNDDASSESSLLELMADWYRYLLDWEHLSDEFDTSILQEMSVTNIIPILLCTDQRNKNNQKFPSSLSTKEYSGMGNS